jgi:hypothetical protein
LELFQINDIKSRLSIDSQSNRNGFDWGTLGVIATENIQKLKDGLYFYGEGTKMLLADIQYAWRLLIKAAQVKHLKNI